jgi:hypothetical protein
VGGRRVEEGDAHLEAPQLDLRNKLPAVRGATTRAAARRMDGRARRTTRREPVSTPP